MAGGIASTIHLVWLGRGARPGAVEACVAAWGRAVPRGWDVLLWGSEEMGELVDGWAEIEARHQDLRAASNRARMEVLARLGGWYVDADVAPMGRVVADELPVADVVVATGPRGGRGLLDVYAMGARAGSGMVEAMRDLVPLESGLAPVYDSYLRDAARVGGSYAALPCLDVPGQGGGLAGVHARGFFRGGWALPAGDREEVWRGLAALGEGAGLVEVGCGAGTLEAMLGGGRRVIGLEADAGRRAYLAALAPEGCAMAGWPAAGQGLEWAARAVLERALDEAAGDGGEVGVLYDEADLGTGLDLVLEVAAARRAPVWVAGRRRAGGARRELGEGEVVRRGWRARQVTGGLVRLGKR
jgi:hypothetical protein